MTRKRAKLESVLEAVYREEIERVARGLRAGFKAGKFRGYSADDLRRMGGMGISTREYRAMPMIRLEAAVCRRLLGAPTKTIGPCTYMAARFDKDHLAVLAEATQRGCMVFLASRFARETFEPGETVITNAISAATRDVLAIARREKWYAPGRGEAPPTGRHSGKLQACPPDEEARRPSRRRSGDGA